jgi:hypothetical protein
MNPRLYARKRSLSASDAAPLRTSRSTSIISIGGTSNRVELYEGFSREHRPTAVGLGRVGARGKPRFGSKPEFGGNRVTKTASISHCFASAGEPVLPVRFVRQVRHVLRRLGQLT